MIHDVCLLRVSFSFQFVKWVHVHGWKVLGVKKEHDYGWMQLV
jgi:hypothetical protein